jgi:succinate dehydrogenase flavin-adding protein (antitoxin of CptAB toxin-antitoxin module)
MLELDLILFKAFECHYDRFTESELNLFEQLLAFEDTTLLSCLQGSEDPPDPELKQLVQKLRQ